MTDTTDDTRKGEGEPGAKEDLPEVLYAPHKPRRNWPDPDALFEHDAALKGSEFSSLPVDVPLVLLPVRLETRLDLTKGSEMLRIRIIPEQLHVSREDTALTEAERDAGRAFWDTVESADATQLRAGLDRLLGVVGPRRLGHVIDATDPEAEKEPDLRPHGAPPRPKLALMPRRWIAIGFTPNGLGFFEITRTPVTHPLEVSATGAPEAMTETVKGVPATKDSKWLYDYAEARDRGMAIDVPLSPQLLAEGRISSLIVFGVAASPNAPSDKEKVRAALQELLEGHERTTGIGFMAQGMVTNNVKGEATGWSYSDADLDRLAEAIRTRHEKALTIGGNLAELRGALGLTTMPPLDRAAGAAEPERMLARAMNTALFEPVLGRFIRDLLPVSPGKADPDLIAPLRSWFIDHVTGGAPLPTLRIGAQPYGMLPVLPLPTSIHALDRPKTLHDHILSAVTHLREDWDRALDAVPLLDPNATDVADLHDRPASDIPAILASQPHPARLFHRRLIEDADEIVAAYEAAVAELEQKDQRLFGLFQARAQLFARAEDIDGQIAVWARLLPAIQSQTGVSQSWKREATRRVDAILAILGQFEQRQRPLKTLQPPLFEGVLGRDLSTYLRGRAEPERAEIALPLVATGDDGPSVSDYLGDLADYVAEGGGKGFDLLEDPPDLFCQLVAGGIEQMSKDERGEVAAALQSLRTAGPAALDRMARETLGLATHRLDAWYTSLANARLKELRSVDAFRTGLSLGAYGWIADLELKPQERASNGFVHAPSLQHATTASVLRAGWLAHGGGERISPAAVDLSSARIRIAQEILEGVRMGQPVGTLLGYRFERGLRDDPARLSGHIRDIRLAVIAQGGTDATADEPVDGRRLLELVRAGALAGLPALTDADVFAHVAAIEAAFDAIHDLALFEGTHAALGGQSAHATAVFEAINQGTQLPPEFRAQATGMGGIGVQHRLMLLLSPSDKPPEPSRGWTHGCRDRLAPDLERWLRGVLPEAGRIGLTLDGMAVTLDRLGVSALDAIYLMGEDPSELSPGLLEVIGAALGADAAKLRELAADLSPSAAEIGLEEVQLLAGELRALLDGSSELTPAGFSGRDGALEPETDASEASAVIAGLAEDLGRAAEDGDLAVLARFGLSGGSGDALRDRAGRVIDGVQARLGAAPPSEVAALLFGRKVAMPRRFAMPSGDAIGFEEDLAKGADRWLEKVGAVRPAVERLTTAQFLGAHLGVADLTLAVGQDRRDPGEGWAAISRPPAGTGGRVSVVAVTEKAAPGPGQPAIGLMVDQWSERIPAETEVTGVAFHHDAPSTRPPQSWLVTALPPERKDWRMMDVATAILDTLRFSALRMVAPEDLDDFGAVLPTIFAQGLRSGGKEDKA